MTASEAHHEDSSLRRLLDAGQETAEFIWIAATAVHHHHPNYTAAECFTIAWASFDKIHPELGADAK